VDGLRELEDLARELEQLYPIVLELLSVSERSRVIIVSSQTSPSSVREALSAGAAGSVPKHAADTELVVAIHRVAGARAMSSPVWAQSSSFPTFRRRWNRSSSANAT
jgi:DNA-binding NarL/FixJ family response regulator